MRLLYLTEYFQTPAEGGLMRTWELSRHLTEAGHSVHVVVPGAHHMTGAQLPELKRRFSHRETVHSIAVTKVWVWPTFRRGKVDRVLYYLTTAICVFGASLRSRPDVVMASSPPFFLAPAAYFLARLKRVPFVLEIRDAWLEFAVAKGLVPRVIAPVLQSEQRWLFRRADRIVAVTPGIQDLIRASLPQSQADKVLLVMNGYEDDIFKAADPNRTKEVIRDWGLSGKFVAIYAGTMGLARDCLTLVRAAARLRGEPEIVFAFVGEGEGKREIADFIAAEGLRNCILVPMQPRQDMPAWFAASGVGLNSIRAGEALESSLSNKIFDYLGAGLPVVWSGAGDTTEFLRASGGGYSVAPGDDEAMAQAVLGLYRDRALQRRMGERGQAYVLEHFSRGKLVEPLERMLTALTARDRRSSGAAKVPS